MQLRENRFKYKKAGEHFTFLMNVMALRLSLQIKCVNRIQYVSSRIYTMFAICILANKCWWYDLYEAKDAIE